MNACTHGFPSPASCVACMYEDGLGAPPVEPVTVEAVFSAKFAGDCPACGFTISEGQRIAKLSNDRYVHAGCVL